MASRLQRITFQKENIISENFWSVKLDLTEDLDKSNWETMVHVVFSKIPNNPKAVAVDYMLAGAIDNTRNIFEKFDFVFVSEKVIALNISETPESFTANHISNDKFFDKNAKALEKVANDNKLNLVFEMNKAIKKCEEKAAR